MLSSVTGWRTLAMGVLLIAWSRTGPVYPVNGGPYLACRRRRGGH
jgi:hypothetical protein